MGLDISHDAFHGAYSAFGGFRSKVCAAMGGTWPEMPSAIMTWYWGDGYSAETHPGLCALLCHSDCDGEIGWIEAALLGNELEALLPEIAKQEDGTYGHIQRQGGYEAVTKKFIAGCRAAFSLKEPLTFG